MARLDQTVLDNIASTLLRSYHYDLHQTLVTLESTKGLIHLICSHFWRQLPPDLLTDN